MICVCLSAFSMAVKEIVGDAVRMQVRHEVSRQEANQDERRRNAGAK